MGDEVTTETGPGLPRPVALEDLSVEALGDLLERATGDDQDLLGSVGDIIETVRELGDEGVLAMTERFDKVRPERLILGKKSFQEALAETDPALVQAMERAARNLRRVAEATQTSMRTEVEVEPGLVVVEHSEPLSSVGCYVPGGKAAYPSSVLMAVVPAKVAGVKEVVVATPPGPDGRPPREVLAACAIAGADTCLVAGGAQAIAALAYGIDSLDPVVKIVGPGNRYVTAAKRLVYGTVDIDSPAGPSEVLIIADRSVDPAWVARDLVAQAEHAEDSRCILLTSDQEVADAVAAVLPEVVDAAKRAPTVHAALSRYGAILVARSDEEACAFARRYAPEHLQIMSEHPERFEGALGNAAAAFIGPWAPVPAGDYLTGANHVLPTGGAARWASPLSVHHFIRRRTEQRLTEEAARALIGDLEVFARTEGLDAHADSMIARQGRPQRLDDKEDLR